MKNNILALEWVDEHGVLPYFEKMFPSNIMKEVADCTM